MDTLDLPSSATCMGDSEDVGRGVKTGALRKHARIHTHQRMHACMHACTHKQLQTYTTLHQHEHELMAYPPHPNCG